MLNKLLELVKLNHFVSAAGQVVPDVCEFGSDNLVSDAAYGDKQAKQGQQEAPEVVDVPCASNITAIIVALEVFFVDVGRLCPYDKGPFEKRVDDDKLEVALLDLALDGLTHAFLAETPKDEKHCHNSKKDVAGRYSNEKPQIHARVLILFEQSKFEPN